MCIIVHVGVLRWSLLGFSPWVSPEIHIPFLPQKCEKQTVCTCGCKTGYEYREKA